MKKLLLNSCCGPCSTAVIERLLPDFDITVYSYNPNIEPYDEYMKRLENQRIVCDYFKLPLIEGEYENALYRERVQGYENEAEGGSRCLICFELRFEKTAGLAKSLGFDCFDTTLTVSPYKNSEKILATGFRAGEQYGIEYLAGNYKKQDGYKRSCQLSEQLGLYRQQFCGCSFSNWTLKK